VSKEILNNLSHEVTTHKLYVPTVVTKTIKLPGRQHNVTGFATYPGNENEFIVDFHTPKEGRLIVRTGELSINLDFSGTITNITISKAMEYLEIDSLMIDYYGYTDYSLPTININRLLFSAIIKHFDKVDNYIDDNPYSLLTGTLLVTQKNIPCMMIPQLGAYYRLTKELE
jgi:hypothetical protein